MYTRRGFIIIPQFIAYKLQVQWISIEKKKEKKVTLLYKIKMSSKNSDKLEVKFMETDSKMKFIIMPKDRRNIFINCLYN